MLHTTLCLFLKNNAFAELLISSTAESALGLPSPVVLHVNTQLGDQVKILQNQLKVYLLFSKNCLNILMIQQFQHFRFLHRYLLIFL